MPHPNSQSGTGCPTLIASQGQDVPSVLSRHSVKGSNSIMESNPDDQSESAVGDYVSTSRQPVKDSNRVLDSNPGDQPGSAVGNHLTSHV